MRLHEDQKGWTISFDDGRAQMIQIDFRLNLLFAEVESHTWLHIETPAWLRCEGAEILLTPEQTTTLAPVLKFFNSAVNHMSIERIGNIRVNFREGSALNIAPHDTYEAWQVGYSNQGENLLLVCAPGGEVACYRDTDSANRIERSDQLGRVRDR
jgi:hypothetical protein